MRRFNITAPIAVAVLAATIGLAACGGAPNNGRGKASFNLKIGDIVPLTGDLADFGLPGRKASDLAVEQINAAIKKNGLDQTVTVTHEDEQTDPDATVSAGRKLVHGGASCITGAYASSDSIPLARSVSVPEKVLQISPASTSDEITTVKDDGFLNRTPPPDKLQGPALAAVMEQDLGGAQGKVVNIGARNDAYGTGLSGTFAAAWQKKGGKIGQKVIYDPKQRSYNSEAQKLVSGGPDAWVMFVDFPETYDRVGPALVRTGKWDPKKTYATDGLASSGLPKSAGAAATEGMRGTAPGWPDKGAAPEAFDRLYTAAPGPRRQTFDAQLFDATILCYLSAVKAGEANGQKMADNVREISGPPGKKYTWQQLPEAIKALQDGNGIDYEGASGPIDMNSSGDATAGVYDLYRYKNGKIEVYDEVPIPMG